MQFADWVAANRAKFGSDYEALFAEQVLPLVEGLAPQMVELQYAFVDSDGRSRYCDFVIVESQAVRVAIEIDGYDKRGTGQGMSYSDFLDWQRRQASLASQGWHVLRFANRDVRDEPSRCAEHISQLLSRLRQAQAGRVEIVTLQSKPITLSVPPHATTAAPTVPVLSQTVPVSKRPRRQWMFVGLATLLGVTWLLRPIMFAQPPMIGANAQTSSPTVVADTSAASSDRNTGPDWLYGKLDCRNPLDWRVAKTRVGQTVTIVGPLLKTKPLPNASGSPMWLDVGGVFPSPDRLTIVLWGRNWHKFDLVQLDADVWHSVFRDAGFAGICIRGRVNEYRGVPQIEIEDPSQLTVGWHPSYS